MPKKPAKAKPSHQPSAPVVLTTPIADFVQLSEADRQVRFAEKAQVNRVSFSEMGKLHYLISEDIAAWNTANPKKKERTIYGELRKLGVTDKSISNASYASRAWRDLVAPDHIKEAAFDRLTFQDCFAIARAMSSRSALQLDGAAVGELITKQPEDFDEELRALYEHGVTVAEKEAQDEKAEADRLKALMDAQTAATKKTPAVETTPAASKTTAATPAAETPTTEAEGTTANTGAEDGGTGPAAEEEVVPTNITTLPPQDDADKNLDAMLEVLAEILKESETFSPTGQQTLLAKFDEARATVAARIEIAAAA